MIVSYCKKCNLDSEGTVCSSCGKRASAAGVRDVWRIIRVPGADANTWRSLASGILLTALILTVSLVLLERFQSSQQDFENHLGGILSTAAILTALAFVLAGGMLMLQGREEIRYTLDMTGAHLQTWHRASYLRSWARLQSAKMDQAIASRDGSRYVISEERHIRWKDIHEIKYVPSAGAIKLYHVRHLAPFILRIPDEEYDTAEAIVKKHTKIS